MMAPPLLLPSRRPQFTFVTNVRLMLNLGMAADVRSASFCALSLMLESV